MLKNLKEMSNYTFTENGDVAFKSTLSPILDFFQNINNGMNKTEQELISTWIAAYANDKEYAVKALFHGRDIRGGAGQRNAFRIVMEHFAEVESEEAKKLLHLIPEYGRWDDLMCLFHTSIQGDVIKLVKEQLDSDVNSKNPSLLAKWLPSLCSKKNGKVAKLLAKQLFSGNDYQRKYRKTLSSLRKKIGIIENNLREKDYTFEYSHVPAGAMLKYTKAFWRNDEARIASYIKEVKAGNAKINSSVLFPHEILHKVSDRNLNMDEIQVYDEMWKALPDMPQHKNILVVRDGSGSMYGTPIEIATALAIYFGERVKGEFHNHFITFSGEADLVEIVGSNIYEKMKYLYKYDDMSNTNLQNVFDLVLRTAVLNDMKQADMPEALLIISDMQFDQNRHNATTSIFRAMKDRYEQHGYKLPTIIFWDVSSYGTHPVTAEENGVILLSGMSPSVMKMSIEGNFNPVKYMLGILDSERYKAVTLK